MHNAEPLISVSGLRKTFGGIVATDGVDLEVRGGEIHAVIGPNGAGKTTLIALIGGALQPDSGVIRFAGREITDLPPYERARLGLARSFQITSIFHDMSVVDNVALAVQAQDGHSYRFWRPARTDTVLVERAMDALARVGLDGRRDDIAGKLSHGERRQLEIAMALAAGPSALLLDEPTAGMGRDETARMVEIIRSLKDDHAILLIEHDMDAVFALADRITVLVYGRIIASGPPRAIRADDAVRKAYLGDEVSDHAEG